MLIKNLVLIGSVAFAAAKEVTGVFTNFESLVFQNAGNYSITSPDKPSWIATLHWVIDGSKEKAGDTFTLNMPCVFKFTTPAGVNSVDLKVNNDVYATCKFSPGEIVVPFSQLQCTVAKIVTGSTYASGTVNFPITFNVGESALQTDLEDSTCFTPGTNTVTFNDGPNKLSTTANFQAGSPMPDDFDPDTIVFRNRAAPSTNEYQHYLLAGNCPNGYRSGKLGFRFSGGTLDCSSVHAAITDQLNAWYFPETESDFSFTPRCTSNGFSISYNNIPAGFRPFIDGLIRQSSSSLTVSYTNSYVCSDFYRYRYNPIIDWGNYDNSGTGSNGNVVVVTTKTWTKSTTQLTTLPFNTAPGNTKTIEVNVPIPTVTTTTTWTGYQTTTTTVTATPGQTATVIVEIPTKRPPNPTTTKTTTWTGLQTSSLTLTNTPGGSDTVIVEVPSNAQTTTTSTWTGNFTTTITSTDHQGGTDTVIIEVPSNAQTTTTSTWTGNFTTTITSTDHQGGTDTVIVEVPSSDTSSTPSSSEDVVTSVTSSDHKSGTDTVIVEVPSVSESILTSTWTGEYSKSATSEIQGSTDTVIIVPSSIVSASSSTAWTGYYNSSIPVSHPQVTWTTTWTSDVTSTYIVSGSQTGTVIEVISDKPDASVVKSTYDLTATLDHGESSFKSAATSTISKLSSEDRLSSIDTDASSLIATIVVSASSSSPSDTQTIELSTSTANDGNQSKSSTRETPLPSTSHSGNNYTPITLSATSEINSSETADTFSIPLRPHESTASGHEKGDVVVSDSNEFGKTTSCTDSSSPTTLQQLTTSATSIRTPDVTSYQGTGCITKISSLSILFISLITTLLF